MLSMSKGQKRIDPVCGIRKGGPPRFLMMNATGMLSHIKLLVSLERRWLQPPLYLVLK